MRKTALEKYMEDGGFPGLISETNRAGYISGLVDAIINTVIAKRFKIRHKDVLKRMATFLSDHYCHKFVAKNVAAEYGMTIWPRITTLTLRAFLLIGINKFSFKSKYWIRNEKVYVVDTALATDKEGTIVNENLGWLLENIICVELLRRCKFLFRDLFCFKTATTKWTSSFQKAASRSS